MLCLYAVTCYAADDVISDAHESSILAEVLGLASIFLPRNPLALPEPYSSPTRLTRLLPQLMFHCATVFYAPRRHSRLLARRPHSPTTLDSPRARLAASCASLDVMMHVLIVTVP
jgi:hypothetical protein